MPGNANSALEHCVSTQQSAVGTHTPTHPTPGAKITRGAEKVGWVGIAQLAPTESPVSSSMQDLLYSSWYAPPNPSNIKGKTTQGVEKVGGYNR